MTEYTGTIYKCEKCNYTSTTIPDMEAHEKKCDNTQLKNKKNQDKRAIYESLDLIEMNQLIKNFIIEYVLPIPILGFEDNPKMFVDIGIRQNGTYELLLDKNLKSIFDWTKFKIMDKLRFTPIDWTNIENILENNPSYNDLETHLKMTRKLADYYQQDLLIAQKSIEELILQESLKYIKEAK